MEKEDTIARRINAQLEWEIARPTTPARSESTAVSVISCRTTRLRLAPSDNRTPISRWRFKARASRRFERFVQAIKRINPNAVTIGRTLAKSAWFQLWYVARDSRLASMSRIS